MDPNQQLPQQIPGMPQPAGTDENGNPFWIIEERQVSWADMQQYMWEQQQQNPQPQAVSSSGGIESMPQIKAPEVAPNIPASPESGPEFNPERGAERTVEVITEQAPQERGEDSSPQVKAPPTVKAKSYIGDTPELESVDTTSPTSMSDFSTQHKNDPNSSSGKFLSVFFDKLLKILSLGKP